MVVFSYTLTGNFNPRSPHGERQIAYIDLIKGDDFNPRSPHGERHGDAGGKRAEFAISTHAPRTGSDADDFLLPRQQGISTHAPRTGSDRAQLVRADGHLTISTHAPRTGSDSGSVSGASITATISTHAPRTGSDLARMRVSMPRHSMNFNPRSPHGERPERPDAGRSREPDFNPRSPHGERPHLRGQAGAGSLHFIPRSPHGERPRPAEWRTP